MYFLLIQIGSTVKLDALFLQVNFLSCSYVVYLAPPAEWEVYHLYRYSPRSPKGHRSVNCDWPPVSGDDDVYVTEALADRLSRLGGNTKLSL